MTPSATSVRSAPCRCVSTLVAALVAATTLQGCAVVAGGGGPSEPPLRPVILQPTEGTVSPFREQEAQSLLDRAREALVDGRAEEAARLAARVAEEYSATVASGPSLLVRARAELALGRQEEARRRVERYANLLPSGDPRAEEMSLFRAEELLAHGRTLEGIRAIVALPADLPAATRSWALHRVRSAAGELGPEGLASVLGSPPPEHPLAVPLMIAYARALRERGEPGRARRFAEAALAVGATGADEEEARSIVALTAEAGERGAAGEPSPTADRPTGPFELAAPVTVGALLPTGGSPTMARYAGLLEEGIRVALEGRDAPDGISVRVEDAAGRSGGAAGAVRAVAADDVIGILGPLDDAAVVAAADARTEPVPIISPTALDARGREAVYTLGGPDPGAARLLARYAMESGLDQVVVIHPETEERAYEAAVFRSTMLEMGGSVLRVIPYPEGTTTFDDILETARFLEPEALVLPVPAEDIQALAPQVSFFGLDTLGIRIMGTDEWTSEEVRRNVAPRHTDGVVIATTRPPGEESEGFRRFEKAYEEHLQRSLRSEIPALGYDAASLFLEALRFGARTPAELREALERVEGFPGATGVISVEDGRIVREHHLTCIQDGALIPVPPGVPPTAYRPERRGDPARNEPERVPLGPTQVFCPGEPVPDTADFMRRPTRRRPPPGASRLPDAPAPDRPFRPDGATRVPSAASPEMSRSPAIFLRREPVRP